MPGRGLPTKTPLDPLAARFSVALKVASEPVMFVLPVAYLSICAFHVFVFVRVVVVRCSGGISRHEDNVTAVVPLLHGEQCA